jgi:hypothetical protein
MPYYPLSQIKPNLFTNGGEYVLSTTKENYKGPYYELSNGRKAIMAGGKMPELDAKKEDIEKSNQKITLSFLLNLFDGVLETPGRITFMTTNFLDKLDKAFTRPGRIDVIGKFGFADHSQLIAIIEHRYDTKLTPEQLNIINNMHQCITPAEVSRILFENFNDLERIKKRRCFGRNVGLKV